MELYPVFLNINGKKCLVVGGGQVAQRKVLALIQCGAQVAIVSPDLTDRLQAMVKDGLVEYRSGEYETTDLDHAHLVFCATSDAALNNRIATECTSRNIMVNVADDPMHCDFHVPSVVHQGALKIAISTGGKSPQLAKALRILLEQQFSTSFISFVDFVGTMRTQIMHQIKDPQLRAQILKELVDQQTLDLARRGELEQAKERVQNVYYRHWC